MTTDVEEGNFYLMCFDEYLEEENSRQENL